MRFFVRQLLRVVRPGCNVCIHVQQLLAFKNQHGYMGRRDFRGACIDLFTVGGEIRCRVPDDEGNPTPLVVPRLADGVAFDYVGEFVIQKDPQLMAQRMNLHSLQFKTGYARTATDLAPCPNDYVLIFQKPGECPNPVRPIRHAKNPKGWVTQEEWIRDAHGIWTDIRATDVLDVAHARESDQEKHVCPLQLAVIRRCVQLYTNSIDIQPDVTVLDPFMGVGSTAWVCLGGDTQDGPIDAPRNVVGFELKESYHRASMRYVEDARRSLGTRSDAAMLPGFVESSAPAPVESA